ncbi:MAG: hypothetical protein N3B13_12145, partial [Deltaproteobacteria bacterium]|nr:hypothetical protein [Deltaproteobacteria bacterium]
YNTVKEHKGNFLEQYSRMPEIADKNSVVCLFSDLFSDPDAVVQTISTISGTGMYQYIFHILSNDELYPSKKGLRLFLDPDSEERLLIQCDNIWDEYKRELNAFINSLNNSVTASGKGRYILCKEDMSLRDILLKFFENNPEQ